MTLLCQLRCLKTAKQILSHCHVTEHGGHLGYIGDPSGKDQDGRWIDWRVVDWVRAGIAELTQFALNSSEVSPQPSPTLTAR